MAVARPPALLTAIGASGKRASIASRIISRHFRHGRKGMAAGRSNTTSAGQPTAGEREFVISRVFDAALEGAKQTLGRLAEHLAKMSSERRP
jgi:hypothetical protein